MREHFSAHFISRPYRSAYKHIAATHGKQFHRSSSKGKPITHILNANIGTEPCPAVAGCIKSSKAVFVGCRTTWNDGMRPSDGCLQTFCDNLQIPLLAGAMQS